MMSKALRLYPGSARRVSIVGNNTSLAHSSNRTLVMNAFSCEVRKTLEVPEPSERNFLSAVARGTMMKDLILEPLAAMHAVKVDRFEWRSTGAGTER
jgi:hypothetical protein